MPCFLIADDSGLARAILRKALEPLGYEVVEADTGAAAAELARTRQPMVLLLDVEMPLLDGHDVLRELRSDPTTADIPVIFLTSDGSIEGIVRGLSEGAQDYIAKPFDPRELLARVAVAVRLKLQSDTLRSRNRELERLLAQAYTT